MLQSHLQITLTTCFYMFTSTINIKTCYVQPSNALIQQAQIKWSYNLSKFIRHNSTLVNTNVGVIYPTQHRTKTPTVIINFTVIVQYTALKYQSLDVSIYFLYIQYIQHNSHTWSANMLLTRDCNPGLEFSIPGFGIVEFPIPGSRDPVGIDVV